MMPRAHFFAAQDEQPFKRFHWLALFTTGMGVFTDGYDLSSIAVVLPLVLASFGVAHITGLESGMLAGSALVGAAVGALIFGALAQRGRKKFYGLDVTLMAIMAAAQAFAPDLWTLIAIRFVLGIGIGADYVLSPTIMAEHANRRDRGKKIGLGFGVMWPAGAAAAALVALLLGALGVDGDLRWRLVLSFGSVPAVSVLYLRRKYAGDGALPRPARRRCHGRRSGCHQLPAPRRRQRRRMTVATGRRYSPDMRAAIFGAALLWLLFDIVIYSGILFGPSLIAQGLGLAPPIFSLITSFVFVIPGALIGVSLIDRIGRKQLQTWGFIGAAVMLCLFARLHDQAMAAPAFGMLLFGLYSLLITAGPATVAGAGILGVELSPTRIRTIGQSITVVGGRIGASISAFLFPTLFGVLGETGVIYLLAVVSIIGAICTMLLIPETARRSLEDINADAEADLAPSGAD